MTTFRRREKMFTSVKPGDAKTTIQRVQNIEPQQLAQAKVQETGISKKDLVGEAESIATVGEPKQQSTVQQVHVIKPPVIKY
jgi:hypothetical protein